MKLLIFSKTGATLIRKRVVKSRRTAHIVWGPIEVPRDGIEPKPYPEEKPEWRMRRYRSSSGEGPYRGKRIVATPQAYSEAKVKITILRKDGKKYKPTKKRKGHKPQLVRHKAFDPRKGNQTEFGKYTPKWTNATE